jgi:hypothetical protein
MVRSGCVLMREEDKVNSTLLCQTWVPTTACLKVNQTINVMETDDEKCSLVGLILIISIDNKLMR